MAGQCFSSVAKRACVAGSGNFSDAATPLTRSLMGLLPSLLDVGMTVSRMT
jgi:hypothetical protein